MKILPAPVPTAKPGGKGSQVEVEAEAFAGLDRGRGLVCMGGIWLRFVSVEDDEDEGW